MKVITGELNQCLRYDNIGPLAVAIQMSVELAAFAQIEPAYVALML